MEELLEELNMLVVVTAGDAILTHIDKEKAAALLNNYVAELVKEVFEQDLKVKTVLIRNGNCNMYDMFLGDVFLGTFGYQTTGLANTITQAVEKAKANLKGGS